MFDFKINYFITAVEEGSFSAAARKLYISQPALSKQITSLEEQIGVTLFDRSGYRPKLTEEGTRYYETVSELRAEYDDMLREIRSMSAKQIRIAYTGNETNRRVLSAIGRLKRKHPEYEVRFQKCNFEESLEQLKAGNVDLALGLDSMLDHRTGVIFRKFFDNEMCVITSFDHPLAGQESVTIKDIVHEPMVLFSKEYGKTYYEVSTEAMQKAGLRPKKKTEVSSYDEFLTNVSIGMGIAITSRDVVRENEVCVLPLQDDHFVSSYGAAYRTETENRMAPIVTALLEELE